MRRTAPERLQSRPGSLAHLGGVVGPVAASTMRSSYSSVPMGKRRGHIPAACVVARRDGGSDAVSALIHAATMVAAGVFMVGRHVPASLRRTGRWGGDGFS